MSKAKTRIGTPTADSTRLKMRGKNTLEDVVGVLSFTETFYFIATGRVPSPVQTKCFDACLTILMDHGITGTALVTRLVHQAVPNDIQVPLAAGLLMVGNLHVGTMAGAGRLLKEGMEAGGGREWAADAVARFGAQKRRIPGFGHKHYNPIDPRAQRLFDVAREAGVEGNYIALMQILEKEIEKAMGRHLTLNVTGAMGAVLCEIEFPAELMRAVAVIGRAAGLVAHIREEMEDDTMRAVQAFVNSEIEYEDPL